MKQLIIIVLAACFLTACDLERLPYGSYTEESIKKDPETALGIMLNGCYGQMKAWSDVMHRVGEYAGDNIMIRGTSSDDFYTFITYNHTTNNGRLSTFWNNSYKIISQTSDIILMTKEGEREDVDQKIGEAYYLRGTMYFYLCRAFGMPYYQSPETNLGLPIVNGKPKDLENLILPDRSTVKETYAQAIADLRKGEALMTVDRTAAYATKEAAQAMLSRIYLYMSGTYENPNTTYADSAIYYANKVIDSGRYHLLNRDAFMKYNTYSPEDDAQTETIFAVKRVSSEFSGYDHYYGIGGMYSNIDGMGWGEMYASGKYLDLLLKSGKGNRANDARWVFIKPQYTADAAGNKTPAFRFVKDTYNASNVQTGYDYIQQPLKQEANGSYYITISNVNYPLTPVDAANNRYSIIYAGKTYTGDKDYMMILNRAYPMFYIYKCSLQEGESQLHSPIISRLGELYLNMAEAYAKKGDYASALTNLNIIRERSVVGGGYTSLNATNAPQLIDEERELELAFEAHRSFDVFRIGHTLIRRYPGPQNAMEEISATDKRVVQYIPQAEINAYPGKLTQNP